MRLFAGKTSLHAGDETVARIIHGADSYLNGVVYAQRLSVWEGRSQDRIMFPKPFPRACALISANLCGGQGLELCITHLSESRKIQLKLSIPAEESPNKSAYYIFLLIYIPQI